MIELRAASLFREIPVTSTKTVLPLQPDAVAATFNSGSPASPGVTTLLLIFKVARKEVLKLLQFNATQKVLTTGRIALLRISITTSKNL